MSKTKRIKRTITRVCGAYKCRVYSVLITSVMLATVFSGDTAWLLFGLLFSVALFTEDDKID